jgi:PAS domain-containing protein
MTQKTIYEEAINECHDAIIFRKSNGTIISWNLGAEEIYGWSASETIGKITHTLLKTVFPISKPKQDDDLKNTGHWEGVLIHFTKTKRSIYIDSRQIYLKDSDIIVEINRTILSAVEKKENELLKLTIDSIQQSVYVVDMQSRIIFYNSEMTRLFGKQTLYTTAIERVKTYGFFLPDQITPWPLERLPLQRILSGSETSGGIMFVKNNIIPEGVWIMNYAYPLKTEKGILIGGVSVSKIIANASSKGLPSLSINMPIPPLDG